MLVLGLGSNLGDRLQNLRLACQQIAKLPDIKIHQISPVYQSDALLPENAPSDWDMPHLNAAIHCETRLTPLELLPRLKEIEWRIGRKPLKRHWGPRILDIDILAWDGVTMETDALTLPHRELHHRPFALWPLADVAPFMQIPINGHQTRAAGEIVLSWGSRFDGKAPFRTTQLQQRLDCPAIVGVINITPDSFSDGGRFAQVQQVIAQAKRLVAEGAEILDLGAESTSPSATPLDAKTEWARLEPSLTALMAIKENFVLSPKISIDTYHPETATNALALGVDWINDVTGLNDEAMCSLLAASNVDCIIMHHLSIPARKDLTLSWEEDCIQTVFSWGEQRIATLEKKGIARDRLIFDPGIGFGKLAPQSVELIKQSGVFNQLGTRVLIGHSRKSFLSLFTDQAPLNRDIETTAMTLYLSQSNIDYVRVHNVDLCARGLKIWHTLKS